MFLLRVLLQLPVAMAFATTAAVSRRRRRPGHVTPPGGASSFPRHVLQGMPHESPSPGSMPMSCGEFSIQVFPYRRRQRGQRQLAALSHRRQRRRLQQPSSYRRRVLVSSKFDDNHDGLTNIVPSFDATELRNEYFSLRHGQSQANVVGLIASDPATALEQFGLSPVGHRQAAEAADQVLERYYNNPDRNRRPYDGLLVLSSDFLRARETAQYVVDAASAAAARPDASGRKSVPLWAGDVLFEERLRERWFGDWDGTDDCNYEKVWKEDDAVDANGSVSAHPGGVESPRAVQRRVMECVLEWDSVVSNHMVVCVAHGDVLQILQTAFSGIPAHRHRTLPHLETAALRRLSPSS